MGRKTLYLVFVHGFKGDDDTFGEFPNHLSRLLQGILPNVKVKPVVYPQYETSGDLAVCVDSFREWLVPILEGKKSKEGKEERDRNGREVVKKDREQELVRRDKERRREKEGGKERPKDDGKAREQRKKRAAVLVGHSMGGILIAETIFSLAPANLVQILGVLAFDTPYLGVNAKMLANATGRGINQAKSIYGAVSTVTSIGGTLAGVATSALGSATSSGGAPTATDSRSSPAAPQPQHKPRQGPEQTPAPANPADPGSPSLLSWVLGAGSLAAVTAGAAYAYTQRSALGNSWTWIDAHLRFVKVLFEPNACKTRLLKLLKLNPRFANFYTLVMPKETFCRVPDDAGGGVGFSSSAGKMGCWIKVENGWVKDEVSAHTGLFTRKANSVYAAMCKEAARFVEGWVREWAKEVLIEESPVVRMIEADKEKESKERRKSLFARSEVSSKSKSSRKETLALASGKDPSKELAKLKISDPPDRRRTLSSEPVSLHSPKDKLKAPAALHSPKSVKPASPLSDVSTPSSTPAPPPSEAPSQRSYLSYFWGSGSGTTVAEPEEVAPSPPSTPKPTRELSSKTPQRAASTRSTASHAPSKARTEPAIPTGMLNFFAAAPKPKRAATESVLSGSSGRTERTERTERKERSHRDEKGRDKERERRKREKEGRERGREETEKERRERKKVSRSKTG